MAVFQNLGDVLLQMVYINSGFHTEGHAVALRFPLPIPKVEYCILAIMTITTTNRQEPPDATLNWLNFK